MARPRSGDERALRQVRDLVDTGANDPLAPFALRPDKDFVFSPDGLAAIGYRVRFGTAVASGDPVGEPGSWRAAIDAFVREARRRSWRVAVLGCGERARPMWQQHELSAVPIGRDVVLRCADFDVRGRRFRNLRQAVQRSRNLGVAVEFTREGELPPAVALELRDLLTTSRREDGRGFAMILGRMFDGREPDAVLAIARDATGRIVGAHRYLWAGKQDLSLDLPIRSRTAPNGVDERLTAETVAWGREHGVERISLAFAPFPDLYEDPRRFGRIGLLLYHVTHLLDPVISVERLYRYLRKFHAFDQERYVMLRWRQVVIVALAMLSLEFTRT
jgi:lysylphosphatidylglycerol synthetase-like protein (DUF2156 family)